MNIINFSPSRQIPWPTSHEWINKNIIKAFRIFPSHLGTTRSRILIYFLLTQVKIINKYNYCHCLDLSQSCLVPPFQPVKGWERSGISSPRSDIQSKRYNLNYIYQIWRGETRRLQTERRKCAEKTKAARLHSRQAAETSHGRSPLPKKWNLPI